MKLGPIGAACTLVLALFGLDVLQAGISKVGGEGPAFATIHIAKIALGLYLARCMCVCVGLQQLTAWKSSARALTLVVLLFPLVIFGDLLNLLVSEVRTLRIDCFPGRLSITEELRICLFGPIAEELMFTGFLLAVVRKKLGDLTAMALVAFLFSITHLPSGYELFLSRFVFMSASCVLFLKTSLLWPSIVMHVAVNTSLLSSGWIAELCESMHSVDLPLFVTPWSLALAVLLFLAWLSKERV